MLYLTQRLAIAPATAALMVSVLGAGSFVLAASPAVNWRIASAAGRPCCSASSFHRSR